MVEDWSIYRIYPGGWSISCEGKKKTPISSDKSWCAGGKALSFPHSDSIAVDLSQGARSHGSDMSQCQRSAEELECVHDSTCVSSHAPSGCRVTGSLCSRLRHRTPRFSFQKGNLFFLPWYKNPFLLNKIKVIQFMNKKKKALSCPPLTKRVCWAGQVKVFACTFSTWRRNLARKKTFDHNRLIKLRTKGKFFSFFFFTQWIIVCNCGNMNCAHGLIMPVHDSFPRQCILSSSANHTAVDGYIEETCTKHWAHLKTTVLCFHLSGEGRLYWVKKKKDSIMRRQYGGKIDVYQEVLLLESCSLLWLGNNVLSFLLLFCNSSFPASAGIWWETRRQK